MTYRLLSIFSVAATIAIIPVAKADAPKEMRTVKNKAIALGNFLNAPSDCSSNPGPVPLPRLFEKPSHGSVGLQIVMADVVAAGACPARKIPSIVLFYTPRKDFVGKDSLRVEFEAGHAKAPDLSFLITVEDSDGK
jgi:hypothetical protein